MGRRAEEGNHRPVHVDVLIEQHPEDPSPLQHLVARDGARSPRYRNGAVAQPRTDKYVIQPGVAQVPSNDADLIPLSGQICAEELPAPDMTGETDDAPPSLV